MELVTENHVVVSQLGLFSVVLICRMAHARSAPQEVENAYNVYLPSLNIMDLLKPHCTTYIYLLPLYSKRCLIRACWSPMILFFLC